jgi:hypothetical protein
MSRNRRQMDAEGRRVLRLVFGALAIALLLVIASDIGVAVHLARGLAHEETGAWASLRAATDRIDVHRTYSGGEVLLRSEVERLPMKLLLLALVSGVYWLVGRMPAAGHQTVTADNPPS